MKPLVILLLWVAVSAKESLIRLPRAGKVTRIIGGDLALAGEFPFMVAIYKETREGRFFCAGVLISDEWILTTAQCTHGAMEFTLQMGSNQLQSPDTNRLTLSSTMYYHEPRFDEFTSLAHDIGVIKLRMPITFTDYIQPVKYADLIQSEIYPGRIVDVTGWGQTSDVDAGLVNDLRVAKVTIMDISQCRLYYGDQLSEGMICAEGNYNEGICYGDIGGPLITVPQLGNETVVGAVSSFVSQRGCESLDPTGYTRVDSYSEWVFNTTRDQ